MSLLRVRRSLYRPLPHAVKPSGPPVEARRLVDHSKSKDSPRLLLPAILINGNQSLPLSVLVDSGCEQDLIDSTLVQQLAIKTIPLSVPLRVTAIDGQNLPQITHQTKPLHLVISENHSEIISFFVFPTANSSIILGFNWLQQHNPHINWLDKYIESWSTSCHSFCLRSAVPPGPSPAEPQQSDPPDMSTIPPEYHDLAPVFSKTKALSLPPHRPYDCAIHLLPGAPLPTIFITFPDQSVKQWRNTLTTL